MTILWQIEWLIHRGVVGTGVGGIDGKLTKCELRGVTFYVRENLALDHFLIASNERMGMKHGKKPKLAADVLELCAPKGEWAWIAAAVAKADGLGRTVRRNLRFTVAWAEHAKREADRSDEI